MADRSPYSLDDWHRLHPWPAHHGVDRPTIEYLWHFEVAAPPEDLWRLMADTSSMNRALGTAEMTFVPKDGRVIGTSRNGGVRHEWWEEPWDWVAGQWLSNVRVYERGFMKLIHAVQHVERADDGSSRLSLYFGFIPRGRLGSAAIKLGFPSLEKGYRKLLPQLAKEIRTRRPAALLAAPPELGEDARARLEKIRAALIDGGCDRAIVDELVRWVRTGDEQDLARIQVRERARAWEADEDRVLSVFLHATRAGLLQLSWDVVCPHCRAAVAQADSAGNIPADGECGMCAIDFGTGEAIEITFHVHSSIRAIERHAFCWAEPAKKDHVRVQRQVLPGAEAVVEPTLAPGRWRMRLQGEKRYGYLDAAEASETDAITWKASDPPREVAVISAPTVRLVNDTDAPVTYVIESPQWSDSALRPGRLLSFQEFRDLFSEEYLGTDVQLSVGEQTILFTDMVGSTALYAVRGDPGAFVEVKKHFDEVFAIIAKHRGAVVKTIGDAAMGAFNDPVDAVRASKEIHDAFPPGRTDSPAILRISLNTGPCIAVRLNANIDYFGGTVNVAAKLQAMAESWQVSMTLATWRSPGVAEYIAASGGAVVDLVYESKALAEGVPVKQWTVHDGPR